MAEFADQCDVATCAEHVEITTGKPTLVCAECGSLFKRNNGDWKRYRDQVWIGDRANHTGTQSADSIVDGTSNKVFTAAEKTKLSGVATGATANDTDANLLNRANHTGTQSADTMTDGSTNKAYTAAEKTKLSGIATSATANDTDANLKNRANHTGTQLASTISDFAATALNARSATTALGYSTGAGGTVTQATNKSTAVTLNKLCGTITMHNAALAAGAIVTFTLNNSTMAAGDMIVVNHVSGGTVGPYLITPRVTGAGVGTITVRNTSAGSLGEAIAIGFAVIKAVTS